LAKYAAVVATYSPFLAMIAQQLHMLYYIFDTSFNLGLSSRLLTVTQSAIQPQFDDVNINVRVAFANFFLYQVAYQMLQNQQKDPILASHTISQVYFICDNAQCKTW
jgi:hypothetical protein